jgi:hypothetical protein
MVLPRRFVIARFIGYAGATLVEAVFAWLGFALRTEARVTDSEKNFSYTTND